MPSLLSLSLATLQLSAANTQDDPHIQYDFALDLVFLDPEADDVSCCMLLVLVLFAALLFLVPFLLS